MTPTLQAFNVSVQFYEPRFMTITIPATSLEDANEKAKGFLHMMKDVTVLETYNLSEVPTIKEMISQQAELLGDEELMEALGIPVNPVHDTKELN